MSDHTYGQGEIRQRQNSPFWWVQYSDRGNDVRQSTKIRIADDPDGKAARRWLHKRRVAVEAGNYIPAADRLGFDQMAQGLLDNYSINGYASIGAARASLANLGKTFAGMKAIQINTPRIESYKAARLAQGVAPGTINHELAMLKRAFALAIEARTLTAACKPVIKALPLDNARQGFCDPADFARLLAVLPERLQPFIEFLYLTSWRLNEARSLLAADVNLLDRAIHLRASNSKNRRARLIKLNGRLLELVAEAHTRRTLECPNLFQLDGGPVKNFTKAWRKATASAGLAGLLVHDLRRSGVRNMVRSGIPEAVAMRVSGHITRRVFERYNIISESDLDAVAERLDAYIDERAAAPAKVSPIRRTAA